jgi:hypothetical protein
MVMLGFLSNAELFLPFLLPLPSYCSPSTCPAGWRPWLIPSCVWLIPICFFFIIFFFFVYCESITLFHKSVSQKTKFLTSVAMYTNQCMVWTPITLALPHMSKDRMQSHETITKTSRARVNDTNTWIHSTELRFSINLVSGRRTRDPELRLPLGAKSTAAAVAAAASNLELLGTPLETFASHIRDQGRGCKPHHRPASCLH